MLLPTRHSPRGPLGCTSPRATSRAFVKESGRAEEIPEIPISAQLNHVTPARGLALLRERPGALHGERSGLQQKGADVAADARLRPIECGLRWLDTRLSSATLVEPSRQPQDRVTFGATVRLVARMATRQATDRRRGRSGCRTRRSELDCTARAGARAGDPSEMASPARRYPHRTARNPLRHVNAALTAIALNGFFPTSRRADWRSCVAPIAATMQACNGSYVDERLHA